MITEEYIDPQTKESYKITLNPKHICYLIELHVPNQCVIGFQLKEYTVKGTYQYWENILKLPKGHTIMTTKVTPLISQPRILRDHEEKR